MVGGAGGGKGVKEEGHCNNPVRIDGGGDRSANS